MRRVVGFWNTTPISWRGPMAGAHASTIATRVAKRVFLLLVALAWAETASGQTTTVDFDTPAPPGSSFSLLNGVFQGIDFGTGQWRWESAYNVDPTNHIFFDSPSGTSRTFRFSPAPRILTSMRVFTTGTNAPTGTLTLSDDLGQTITRTVTTGTMQLVTTDWARASTAITVTFTAGWNLGIDDITYSVAGGGAPDPAQIGQWAGPFDWPMVAVHMMLSPTGQVLAWDRQNGGGSARLWNPATGTFTLVPSGSNVFCAGHSTLADGRTLVVGGNVTDFVGIQDANVFDPVTQSWTPAAPMAYPRWYPTATTLPDGRVLVTSGSTTCSTCIADIPEVYDPATNTWTQLTNAQLSLPTYPFMFVLPDGRVLNAGSDETSVETRALDVQAQTWTMVDPAPVGGGSAAMYLPGRVVKSGSPADVDLPSTASVSSTWVIDMTQPSPAWRETAPMAFLRGHHNLTILPDGTVLVVGGGRTTDGVDLAQAVYEAELWSPATETWSTMARMQVPRLYHSTALLLPDGRVLVAGGGRFGGPQTDQLSAEIYSPPSLFRGARPTITMAPSSVEYGSNFLVTTPDASSIARVSLIRLGAVTHSFDQDQRFLDLSFQQGDGSLTVQAPANANLAPPGYYMLFLINGAEVPSVAAFVRL